MNILMVLDHEFPADIRVEKEIRTLIEAGHQVDLACYTREGRKDFEKKKGVTIHRRHISKFRLKTSVGALKFPFYFDFWRFFLSDLLKANSYDAIHIHDLPLAKVGYVLSGKFQIKFVLDLHENWPVLLDLSPHTKSFLGRLLSSNRQWLRYEKEYATKADGLIVVANEMKKRLLSKGVVNNNIHIVPNTSELDTFNGIKECRPDDNFFTLFYSGGINKHRGIEIVISGLAQMQLPDNFRFWIVGSGRNEPFVKKMVSELKLDKYVKFWGWKSQKEVFDLLLKSDVAIIPHLKNEHSDNTSPNKIFHYMLAKKPIIASDCDYIVNIINETKCGIIYRNNSSEDFSQKLNYLLENPQKYFDWGECGYKSIQSSYNWDNTARQLVELYTKF